MEWKLTDLEIDPEFEQQIPGLTSDEFNQLKRNILADGKILTPLIVWGRKIIDGHNRYRILKKHPELPFTVTEIEFDDRYAAMAWICHHQLGRRNLTSEQKRYLIGKQYKSEKQSHGGSEHRDRDASNGQFTSSGQNGPSRGGIRTRERIAAENNTSVNYVRRAEKFAEGVDAADAVLPGIKQELLSGTIRPLKKDVAAVGRAPAEKRLEMAKQLRDVHLPGKKPQKERADPGKTMSSDQAGDVTCKEESSKENISPAGGDPHKKEKPEDRIPDKKEGEQEPPARKKTKAEILSGIEKISEDMLHSEGVAAATEEHMMNELADAFESMKWRWDTCAEFYPNPVRTVSGQKKIRELAREAIRYFETVLEGVLWDEDKRVRLSGADDQ